MSIKIIPANSSKEIKKFIDFQHELYRGDTNYVPELFIAQKEMFDKKKYPFYEHGEVQCFLAYRNDKVVGRIAAVNNKRYNEYHNSNIGFIGFFDFEDDLSVAKELLGTAKQWLAKFKFDRILGPMNFSTNETAGLLVDGYNYPPMVMMTYNSAYYEKIYEALGFAKEMDLYAYAINGKTLSDKAVRLCNVLEKRLASRNITIRNLNLKDFKNEAARIKSIYNSAWEKNWGFVPFSDKEFDHLAEALKLTLDPKFGFIAEHEGKPIGFSVALPDINEITKNFRKGRLLPFNIFKLLWNKNKTKNIRVVTLGVIEGYRRKGIEAVFYARTINEGRNSGKYMAEASWILENNAEMNQAAVNLNGERYKTYRIYGMDV